MVSFGPWEVAKAALVLLAIGAGVLAAQRPEEVSGRVRVVDGDTLAVAGRTLRLTGIDAPEMAQSCGPESARYRCGERAREALRSLANGRDIACRVRGRDRYGRGLAACSAGGRDLGAALVRQGLAVAYGGYASEERDARRASAGLWAGPFERPAEWRKARANARG